MKDSISQAESAGMGMKFLLCTATWNWMQNKADLWQASEELTDDGVVWGKEWRLAGRDGWIGNHRRLQIINFWSTKTRKKECSSSLKPSFSWSLLRIHESMAVIGLEFVWRHKAPVQMSLTCYLLPLWSSYEFCW